MTECGTWFIAWRSKCDNTKTMGVIDGLVSINSANSNERFAH